MLTKEQSRTLLSGQYHAYASLLDEHGIPFPYLNDEEVNKLTDADLQRQVRILRDLARTPTS